ncbi:hypothetical protein L484_005151 [Morus notabilis]|uniref:B3 domain-containing protein n=1 Tax=Morus notabilis TaxID=981085 RepID=W9R0N0_9ROSA|nr:B3 domain-containing protein At2g24670 [Morus notabilis]EXB53602.1 hypothetical protein L484_005151 [Morus notabilis]
MHPQYSSSLNGGESENVDKRSSSTQDLDSEEFDPLKELAVAATDPAVLELVERQADFEQSRREARNARNDRREDGGKNNRPTSHEALVLPRRILRNKIDVMGGTEVNFVLQKSFVAGSRGGRSIRLPIRSTQITSSLRDAEKRRLDVERKSMAVKLIDQSFREFQMEIRRWDGRTNGKIYALATKWNDVVSSNHLEEGDDIKLWSFRVDDHLHFALQTTKKAARLDQ